MVHPLVSGNKYRKLKYNLATAKTKGFKTLLTFGGAYSNHIVATACAGRENGFKTIGIIRGDELQERWRLNPSLLLAAEQQMQLYFVDRETYRRKTDDTYVDELKSRFGSFYLLPEGGTNTLAVKGCEEIITEADHSFDVITCPVGTCGTMAGLINASQPHQTILGFQALKGDFLTETLRKFATKSNWTLVDDYHFGGYAKVNDTLVKFINSFRKQTQVPLDPIYTGKMVYGLLDMVKNNKFKIGSTILAVHTGGLQGIIGMNDVLKKKNLPLINI